MSDKNMRRNNGSVTEKAHLNGDTKKFDCGYTRIFGVYGKEYCSNDDCGLSIRVKVGEDFICKHCDAKNFHRVRNGQGEYSCLYVG